MAGKFLNNFFGMNDDATATNYYDEPKNDKPTDSRKVVSIKNVQALRETGKIALFEPRIYGDARDITEQLLNGQAVIINFRQMDPKLAVKTVDFLNGAVFAMDGEIRRIGEQIFLCTPKNFEVTGKTMSDLENSHQSFDD
ncbi:cell division protein SepF [uncultured Limosilactobacillus sp.]|uniref:cell division protein SepF n=1 Tax=uncultured Limosilactobacillus sp. TaxID=2837629 RepID=UPI0025D00B8E|nr:cell division protein SepF [uncultured Limosilactobacillus sp.]